MNLPNPHAQSLPIVGRLLSVSGLTLSLVLFTTGFLATVFLAPPHAFASSQDPSEREAPSNAQDPEQAQGPEDQEPQRKQESGAVTPPEPLGQGDSVGYDSTDAESADDTSMDDNASESSERSRPEIAQARLIDKVGHRSVISVTRLGKDVGRIDWSRQGDWLAFDKVTDRGFRGLYVGNALGRTERCLTCESWDLRKAHVLAPTWHPSGKMIVAMVQKSAARLKLDTWQLASPERGLHPELWAFTADGRDAWALTQVVPQGGTVSDPHFSFEGNRLAWTQRVDTTVGGRWGSWEVRIADFKIKRGLPRLGKIQRIRALPWPGWVTIHGFTEDDQGLLLTVTPAPGTARKGGRKGFSTGIYRFDTKRFTPLPAPGNWDAFPSQIPRSERRVWVSDRGIERPRTPRLPWRGDLWLASESGRRQERLTYFNDPSSDHFLGEAWIADTTWSPDGEHLLLQVLSPDESGTLIEYLYDLKLDPTIGR